MEKNRNPEISVLVPIYNVEPYLQRCIDSVISQTFTDWEMILVDDGSLDACSQIADKAASLDNRIISVHKKNGGLISARREGVRHARGMYYMFLDSDDWLDTNALALLYSHIIKGYDMVKAGGRRVTHKGKSFPLEKYKIEEGEVMCPQDFIEAIYMGYTAPYLWGALYKAELFDDDVFNESIEEGISLGEDAVTNMIVGKKMRKVLYIKDLIYNYFFNPESIMSTKTVSSDYGERMQNLLKNRVFEGNEYLLDLQTARRASYTFRNCFIPEKGFSENYDRDVRFLKEQRYRGIIENCIDAKFLLFATCKPLYRIYSYVYRTTYKYIRQKGIYKKELK